VEIFEMTEEMIPQKHRGLPNAAARAQLGGFGNRLHAGHGWQLSFQFLAPWSNTRTDRWGQIDRKSRAVRGRRV
jgi:2,4-dienoyl-CoA reductase-like NADH-dependent reductase (Old Yellow Enzyme family)